MSTSPGRLSDGVPSVSDHACVTASTLVPSSAGEDVGITGAVPNDVAARVPEGSEAMTRTLISEPSSARPRL
jgi:hypothetical protein